MDALFRQRHFTPFCRISYSSCNASPRDNEHTVQYFWRGGVPVESGGVLVESQSHLVLSPLSPGRTWCCPVKVRVVSGAVESWWSSGVPVASGAVAAKSRVEFGAV